LTHKSLFIVLVFLIYGLIKANYVFGGEDYCSKIKHSINEQVVRLIDLIESIETCSEPFESFRDKVFSSLKYRSNRLKKCVKMVQEGNFGFDCSREFRKSLRSQGNENCVSQLGEMKIDFKYFLDLSLEHKICLGL
jgi:hypothetical protein